MRSLFFSNIFKERSPTSYWNAFKCRQISNFFFNGNYFQWCYIFILISLAKFLFLIPMTTNLIHSRSVPTHINNHFLFHACAILYSRLPPPVTTVAGANRCAIYVEVTRRAPFSSTYTRIGTIQTRLTWPLHKDEMQIHEYIPVFKKSIPVSKLQYFF